ncbi:L-seryl-tRNA(Sec) selenium transferase [Alkalihalobacillus sp. AL-G]|uniref:L-seryl-tRNA(Sec) selenium transferase n=1 Tax=Alkalihalobacillus sp. AL-G TaxID=2926399 RepID=UPI00272D43D9|nr:L-seryl-tRNA(Sec) selenium transferase [Alkalihalobacillus sp. AL-G]WLD95270.1 L-seryl-tRNA(Sec) selenium transferase [Alkalihalobacillus sp. AL-G]
MKNLLQVLPAVHTIQADERFTEIVKNSSFSIEGATKIVQEQIDQIRSQMLEDRWDGPFTKKLITDDLLVKLETELISQQTSLRPMINATGVILHTNLGRARLSERAVQQMISVARHYSNLEYDIEKGGRGSRHSLVEGLLCEITSAEAAMVVNNNAAAVFLTLRSLAREKSVIVSRGELVEIGGSFRVSSIMEESGAVLKEIGTTNKTHLRDYEQAIDETTSMIMKVHTSNFKVIGFAESVPTVELVNLADQHDNILTYEDLGSGALYDLKSKGIGSEPLVKDVIESGIDVVTFSGDKLLGGPQAGIIAGKASIIEQLKKHQLARALRVDKFTLAALEATLLAYKYDQIEEIPTLRDILSPLEEIQKRAEQFFEQVSLFDDFRFTIQDGTSRIGGGTMPEVELPTSVVSVRHNEKSTEELNRCFRESNPPIIGRIKGDELLLDFRTITKEEQVEMVQMIKVFNKE